MGQYRKSDGSITIKGGNGKITGNVAGDDVAGPQSVPTLSWGSAEDDARIRAFEQLGIPTSDAQAMVDAENMLAARGAADANGNVFPTGFYAFEEYNDEGGAGLMVGGIYGPFASETDAVEWMDTEFIADEDSFEDMMIFSEAELQRTALESSDYVNFGVNVDGGEVRVYEPYFDGLDANEVFSTFNVGAPAASEVDERFLDTPQ